MTHISATTTHCQLSGASRTLGQQPLGAQATTAIAGFSAATPGRAPRTARAQAARSAAATTTMSDLWMWLTPISYQFNHENLFFRDPEIIDFWVPGRAPRTARVQVALTAATSKGSRSGCLTKWFFGGLRCQGQHIFQKGVFLFGLAAFGGKRKTIRFWNMCSFLALVPQACKKPFGQTTTSGSL